MHHIKGDIEMAIEIKNNIIVKDGKEYYATRCEHCKGAGYVWWWQQENASGSAMCFRCNGTGYILKRVDQIAEIDELIEKENSKLAKCNKKHNVSCCDECEHCRYCNYYNGIIYRINCHKQRKEFLLEQKNK